MHVEQQAITLTGMDCAEEVDVLKKELGPIVGAKAVSHST